ncbi:hypothetical protein Lbir_3144 [Legionella birminghamensis]|uniref:VipA n=1 Tax=Legionella birminghamensis TaxID=28083 RepID=A0A378ICL7_9GAMM|nr:hypothetical protein [Legionella birminghamensis]KTC66842.1 hypothetical protein Lbir_3144 [Legionella birminghamensis]STX32967.1 Uncharacterised protein [Legionella birminghamensis]
MSLSKEFISLFSTLIEQYEKSNLSRYLSLASWKKDVHAEKILENIKSLYNCFSTTPDVFDEDNLLDYLNRSSLQLLTDDPIFLTHMGEFNKQHAKNRKDEHHLGTALMIKINAKTSLTGNLMEAIFKERNAHCLEILAYRDKIQTLQTQIEQLSQQILDLKLQNDELERHRGDKEDELQNLREQVNRYNEAWGLIQKASHSVNPHAVNDKEPPGIQLPAKPVIKEAEKQPATAPVIITASPEPDTSSKSSPLPTAKPPAAPPPPPGLPPRPATVPQGEQVTAKRAIKLQTVVKRTGQTPFFKSVQEELEHVLKNLNKIDDTEASADDKKKNSFQTGVTQRY